MKEMEVVVARDGCVTLKSLLAKAGCVCGSAQASRACDTLCKRGAQTRGSP